MVASEAASASFRRRTPTLRAERQGYRSVYLMPNLRRMQIDHARLEQTFYRAPTTPDKQRDFESAATQHDDIIDAMERGDPERAGALASEHFAISRRRMAEYVTPEAVDLAIDIR